MVTLRLMEDVRKAHAEHLVSSANFDLIVKAAPSGIPSPDGSLRLHKAGKEFRANLEKYVRALQRYTDYTLQRVVPGEESPAK